MADPLLTAMLADAASLSEPVGSPAMLFPSEVNPRTRGVGFTGIGTSSSKLFSVVKVSRSDRRVCFGKIGAGSAFCIRIDCSFKAHVESKVSIDGSDLEYVFICQNVGSSAFVEPVVSERQIPEKVWEEWDTKTLPLNEWRREFQAVLATDDKFASFEDIKMEAKFLDTAETFRTPGKRKRELDERFPVDSLGGTKPAKYERVLPAEEEELEKVVQYGMKKGILTGVVSGLETNVILIQEGLEEVATLTSSRFRSNEETLSLLAGVINNVRSSIGTPVEVATLFMAPTMWGTVSIVADEVLRAGSALQDLTNLVNSFRNDTVSQFLGFKTNGEALMKIATMLMSSIKKMTVDNQSVKSSVEDLLRRDLLRRETERGQNEAKTTDVHEDMVNRFSEMLNSNKELPTADRSPRSRHDADESSMGFDTVPGSGVQPTTVHSLSDHPILTPENYKKFRQLVEDVGLLKVSAEATSIKFGNLGIRNLQECSTWVKKNYPDARYGLVIDPLTLLDRLFGDDEVDPITQLKTMESMSKLNIETGAESSALTSLRHPRPRMFHKGRPMIVCDAKTSRLNLLPKPLKWKSGTDGIRNHIVERMNVLHPHIRDDIDYAFGKDHARDSKAHMIATLSLTSSVTFITQLLNYIDTLYEKLHIYSKFTTETAWSLAMQVLDRILADLYAPKEGVSNGMKGDRESICSHLLYASFKTLDVAQVYVDANFVNHPAISSEFIKFLATNSGSEKIEQLNVTVAGMKTTINKAATDSKNASTKSDTASTKCGELSALITALTRRIKTLEDRPAR
ncbi:hypothetical protein MHU86_4311 [Fragilaria crotonensis]|nr:hypothetical protein MHU86_4311 [Fragilaria crotonensis]